MGNLEKKKRKMLRMTIWALFYSLLCSGNILFHIDTLLN